MPLLPPCILRPIHLYKGVITEAHYRASQRARLARGRVDYPQLIWPHPHAVAVTPRVFIAHGKWQVQCVTEGCGDYPSASPEWRLALCFNCGAIYDGLAFPDDVAEIERILVNRPSIPTRNWNWPKAGETAADLRAQNRQQGDPD